MHPLIFEELLTFARQHFFITTFRRLAAPDSGSQA